jgi:hypothetical protein
MGLEFGFFGLILLILNVWAIISTFQSTASVGRKVLWVVLILIFPLLGFILWLMLGPKKGSA